MKTQTEKESLLTEVPDELSEKLLTEVPPTDEGELLIEEKKPLDESAIEDIGSVGDLSTGFVDGPTAPPKKARGSKANKKSDKANSSKKEKKIVEEDPAQREYTLEQRKKLLQNYSKRTLMTRFGIKF